MGEVRTLFFFFSIKLKLSALAHKPMHRNKPNITYLLAHKPAVMVYPTEYAHGCFVVFVVIWYSIVLL